VIRVSQPSFGPDVEALVLEVLRSGHLAQGPMVARLEELGAEMAGSRYAVAVANGTVSLEAALEVCGVGPGDEVITAPFTFAATVNAILRTGATVRFADLRPDYTVDVDSVAALLNERTRALLPVHLYGLMADMPRLERVADRYGLAIIEDSAQAHGASVDGRPAGSFGIGSFSFYATKNVAAGEGGLLSTSDEDVARQFRLLRNQGMVERYRYEIVGRNIRMTDLAAAVAIPQMERLDEINAKRQANAAGLTERLADVDGLVLPSVPAGRVHVWHQYTVLVPEGTDRAAVQEQMREFGVESGIYYPYLAWDYEVYRDHPGVVRDDTPFARMVADRCLSLPVHPALGEDDLDTIAAALRKALG
jgi:dTDP-4-amino-4,6-dideoxygalactose transaminase